MYTSIYYLKVLKIFFYKNDKICRDMFIDYIIVFYANILIKMFNPTFQQLI